MVPLPGCVVCLSASRKRFGNGNTALARITNLASKRVDFVQTTYPTAVIIGGISVSGGTPALSLLGAPTWHLASFTGSVGRAANFGPKPGSGLRRWRCGCGVAQWRTEPQTTALKRHPPSSAPFARPFFHRSLRQSSLLPPSLPTAPSPPSPPMINGRKKRPIPRQSVGTGAAASQQCLCLRQSYHFCIAVFPSPSVRDLIITSREAV